MILGGPASSARAELRRAAPALLLLSCLTGCSSSTAPDRSGGGHGLDFRPAAPELDASREVHDAGSPESPGACHACFFDTDCEDEKYCALDADNACEGCVEGCRLDPDNCEAPARCDETTRLCVSPPDAATPVDAAVDAAPARDATTDANLDATPDSDVSGDFGADLGD